MKHKQVIISLILFFVVITLLGISFSEWGFDRDDCGVIYHSRLSTWTDFYNLFVRNDLHSMVHASNYAVPSQYFFSVFYRPLTFFWYGLQLPFFGAWPYGYFLVMICFHALNVVLFFNMIIPFFDSYLWAILCTLLFAFHSSLWVWMGWIAAQPYTISMTFILLATILFFKHLTSNTWWYKIFSVLCFCIALLTFELVIVYPIFLLMVYGAHRLLITHDIMPKISYTSYIYKTLCHWLIFCSFLILRVSLFPINFVNDPSAYRINLSKFLIDAQSRTGDLKTFIVHALGLDWVPSSQPWLKICLVLAIIALLVYCLYHRQERTPLSFLTLGAFLFMWPAILRYFVPRYMYYSLPVFVFIMIFLLYKTVQHHTRTCMITISLLIIFIVINAGYLVTSMHSKIPTLKSANRACEMLAHDPRIKNNIICFIAVPRDLFWTGLAQQMWLRGVNPLKPIYYDMSTFSCSVHDGKQRMKITSIKDGFRLTSLDHNKLWWISWGGEYTKIGEKKVHTSHENYLYDFDFILDKKYRNMGLVFVTWDYEYAEFKILNNSL